MTPLNRWSVRLLLDENAIKAMDAMNRFESWPFHGTLRRMVIGGYGGTEALEDAPFVTLELEADGPDAAERLAHRVLDQAGRDAGVGRQRSTVVWVAPLRDDDVSSHRFLEQAKDLFEAENYELAIVAAQVHFQLQVRLLMERASGRLGTAWARRLTKNPRCSDALERRQHRGRRAVAGHRRHPKFPVAGLQGSPQPPQRGRP